MKRKYYKIAGLLVILLVALAIIIAYYTDYLWYQSLGLTQVFIKPILGELLVKFVFWLLGFIFLLANVLPMADQFRLKRRPRMVAGIEVIQREFSLSKKILILIAFGLSLFWVWALPRMWDKVMLFLNSAPTGQVDPILGRDLSYYFFKYPLYSLLSTSIFSLLFFTVIIVLSGYLIGSAINFAGLKTRLSPKALTHFSILLAIILLWYALTRGLAMADLLISPSESHYGAGYTDVNIQLPLLKIERILGLLLVILALVNIRLKKFRLFLAAPAILILVAVTGGIIGGLFEKFVVNPNQLVREAPYINHHIKATRDAYGLSSIIETEYPISSGELSPAILERNQATINNIRLLDYRPLKQHYNQNQSLTLYYEFNDIDIDRYKIGEESSQVMLSIRELNVDSLPDQAQNLINRHFKYTHGYGLAMSPVNKITANGHPIYYFSDIPVKSQVDIPLTQPEIYFGELTNEFIVVGTKSGEFGQSLSGDESDESQKETVRYAGKDGVKLTAFRRLLYALNFGKPILIFSDEITSESKILYHRNIVDRAQKAAPFIHLDSNAYPVIAEGKIYWLLDGYTTSGYYPYAQPTGRINYIRNSVKIVIDAYNGDVSIYKFDDTDPLIKAWEKIFPGLIKDREAFPASLEAHIRYPVDYFEIQAAMLKNYHMTDTQDFYNRENVWEIAVEKYSGTETQVEPYYVTMQLPGQDKAEFILKLPFTPLNRNNMVAWLAAGNDGENYGKLFLYNFPRGQLIEGPSQIDAYIDQDPIISQQLTLWSQGGSNVVRGNLLTIPIEGRILYVEPLFILSQNRSIPELRRVILYYNNTLVMESTLDQALTKLFGERKGTTPSSPGTPETPGTETPTAPETPGTEPGTDLSLQELAAKINQVFEAQQQAAREGRWADYGTYGEQLESLIKKLAEMVQ
ncbi:MAG TPA: UPF0182 family protein [Peptococcaceae bacterium]|nr:UPF0182 family protein [Peptococcaceae bacterium]